MFGVEKQQLGICLLKSNLDVIEEDLVVHRSALPELDAENEMKCRETIAAFNTVRSYSEEIDKFRLENGQLTAQRLQLKRKIDEVSKNLQSACKHHDALTDSLKQEMREMELQVFNYEESLKEKADRFRKTTFYHKEEEINKEIDGVNSVIAELQLELNKKQLVVDDLKGRLDDIHPELPENFLDIVGKQELEQKAKSITEEYEALAEKLKAMLV